MRIGSAGSNCWGRDGAGGADVDVDVGFARAPVVVGAEIARVLVVADVDA